MPGRTGGGSGGGGSTAIAVGRAKYGGTVQYSIPGLRGGSGSTFTLSGNRAQYMPFQVDAPITIDQLVAEVTTAQAAQTFRIAIYNADTDWQPTTLVVDSGAISAAATGVIATTVSDTTLAAGRYLFWINSSATGTVLRSILGNAGQFLGYPVALGSSTGFEQIYVAQTYGAAPSTGLAWSSVATNVPHVFNWAAFVRVKTP